VDIPLSRAFDTTWAAMEKLVDCGKTKMIGELSEIRIVLRKAQQG